MKENSMNILEERKLWNDNQVLYSELACNYQDQVIPTECFCGVPWEPDNELFGCWACGYELPEEYVRIVD